MKILLLRPPYRINRYSRNVPLAYFALAAWLRDHGHEPVLLDRVFPDQTESRLEDTIRDGVDIIGIGAMTCEFEDAVQEARKLKGKFPLIPIVLGGAHASGNARQCLESGAVDYVISGEGEIALTALLDALQNGNDLHRVPGIGFMENGEVVQGPPVSPLNPEMLPMPAYDMVDLEAYFRLDPPWHFPRSRRVIQFMTSRGCPFKCSYCHRVHGKQTRLMPAKTVVDQMEHLHKAYGVEEFIIVDDVFNIHLERAKSICRGIVDRGLPIHLQFPNGLRGDVFDAELMELLAKAHTHYLAVAIETASPRLQRLIGKNLDISRALHTVKLAHRNGIEVGGFFMIGFPSETRAELEQTFQLAFQHPFDVVFFSVVTPYAGTQLRQDILNGVFGEAAKNGLEAQPDADFPMIASDTITPGELFSLRRGAYLRFYSNPRRMWNLLKKMGRPAYAKQIVKAVFRRLFLNGETTVT